MLTANDIFSDARAVLADPTATRYTDVLMTPWLNAVQGRLFSMRPECVLQDDDETLSGIDSPAPVTEATDPLGVADRWRQVLVDGLLSYSFQIDDDEAPGNARGLSAAYEAKFINGARTL